jgi:hypothetical protein
MFGSKKRERSKRLWQHQQQIWHATDVARGEQLYPVVRANIVEYANGSDLNALTQSAIRGFLQSVDSDKSWLFDPSFSMLSTGKASPSMKAHFTKAEANFTKAEANLPKKLSSLELGARNAVILQDLDTIRDTATRMLADSFVEWFEFLEGDSERARGDYVISYACAENVLQARYAIGPDVVMSHVIGQHVAGICMFISAMWGNSSQRASLEAFA